MTPLPFVTTDTNLALCLEFAGQKRLDVWNCYSEKKLSELGCSTIREAMSREKPGVVRYFFERTTETTELVAAYYDQRARNKEICEVNATREEAVRLLCAALAMRKDYVKLWKTAPAKLLELGDVKHTSTESLTITADMVKDGPCVIDGIERKEGDVVSIAGSTSYGPTKCVGIAADAATRKAVGL